MCHDALSLWPICVAVNGSKTPSQRLPPPPRNEDWSKIRDPVERRKIQNRIAQRNYRKERADTGLHSFAKARVGKRSKQRLALLRNCVSSERTSSESDSRTDVRPCEPVPDERMPSCVLHSKSTPLPRQLPARKQLCVVAAACRWAPRCFAVCHALVATNNQSGCGGGNAPSRSVSSCVYSSVDRCSLLDSALCARPLFTMGAPYQQRQRPVRRGLPRNERDSSSSALASAECEARDAQLYLDPVFVLQSCRASACTSIQNGCVD